MARAAMQAIDDLRPELVDTLKRIEFLFPTSDLFASITPRLFFSLNLSVRTSWMIRLANLHQLLIGLLLASLYFSLSLTDRQLSALHFLE